MQVDLYFIRERGGVIPKWQRATHRAIHGELSIIERRDDVLNRASRVAEIHDINTGTVLETVPPLFDAQVVHLSKSLMIISGIERIPDVFINRVYDFAQTWWLELPN